ncbi:hypothetical protein D3C71_734350 [compost metagenome]
MGFEAHVAQRLRAFQAQQPPAHDHAGLRFGTRGLHGLQVLDGAVDKAVIAVASGHLGHEGIGAGGQHQLVVGEHFAIRRGHGADATVHRCSARGQAQREAGALEEAGFDQRKFIGRGATEEGRQMHPVVGRARLLAQHGDLDTSHAGFGQTFEELVADHAVANENDFHACSSCKNPGNRFEGCRMCHASGTAHPPRNHGRGLELPSGRLQKKPQLTRVFRHH